MGSGAWPGAGQCRTTPLFLCPGALVLEDAASLLLPKRAPHPHTSSCSPGEGTALGGDTQGWAAEGRPEPRVGFQLRCSPGCAHSQTHGALKSHIILGALTPQTPLAQNPALLTRRAGGEQETQSSAALVVRRGISAPLTSSAASRNAPQVKRAQGKTLRAAPSPLTNQEPAPFLSKTCSVFRAFFPLVSLRKECSERGRGCFPARLRN